MTRDPVPRVSSQNCVTPFAVGRWAERVPVTRRATAAGGGEAGNSKQTSDVNILPRRRPLRRRRRWRDRHFSPPPDICPPPRLRLRPVHSIWSELNSTGSVHSARTDCMGTKRPSFAAANQVIIIIIIIFLFAQYNNTTVCTSTSIQFRRAGQQGPTRTLTAVLKRWIKQLLGTERVISERVVL